MTDLACAHPQTLRAAAAVYRLAARTFAAEVDPPFYRALVDMCGAPSVASAGLLPIDGRLRMLPVAEALDALAVEYCRLFVGPRPVCPPYASAHATGSALGATAKQAIGQAVVELGVVPRPPPGAPIADDDHAAVGLGVLAELCARATADTSARGRQAATASGVRFRDRYLLPWLPGFLAEVERQSRCGPYRPVARLTAAVLRDGTTGPATGGWG
jgi:TorA maturation chaperone TorD